MIYKGTVKRRLLLGNPPTFTTTDPLEAPAGTVTMIVLLLQLDTAATSPLKVTVLLPCVGPKLVPEIVTDVPTGPDTGEREEILKGTPKFIPLLE